MPDRDSVYPMSTNDFLETTRTAMDLSAAELPQQLARYALEALFVVRPAKHPAQIQHDAALKIEHSARHKTAMRTLAASSTILPTPEAWTRFIDLLYVLPQSDQLTQEHQFQAANCHFRSARSETTQATVGRVLGQLLTCHLPEDLWMDAWVANAARFGPLDATAQTFHEAKDPLASTLITSLQNALNVN